MTAEGDTSRVGREGYVAARGRERKEARDLGEIERWVAYLAVTGREPAG